MLYLIGLGLFDEEDISLKGLNAARACTRVYLERYTSPWQGNLERLSKMVGKDIQELRRSDLEGNVKSLIDGASETDVAVFVPGDPLVATTHAAIINEAKLKGIKTRIVHSSSVFSAIAETGLHIYKFGKTTTIAYPEENYFPKSPYQAIKENQERKLHTLCLLDVKAEKKQYMTVNEAIELLLEIEKQENESVFSEETLCVGVARLGGKRKIAWGSAKKLKSLDFGNPPHVLVIPGELHFSEKEFLNNL